MSSFDIGKIKFNWRGTWDAAETYSKDDTVYHEGSSYVYVYDEPEAGAIPGTVTFVWDGQTNVAQPARWQKMAQGSDLGALAGLTAGSIVYYTGSTFQALQAGNQGESLRISPTGNPHWSRPGIEIVQRYVSTPAPGSWEANASFNDVPGLDHSITKQRSDSRLKIHMTWHLYWTGSHSICHNYFYRSVNGGSAYQVKRFTESAQYQEKNVNLVWDESIGAAGDTIRYWIQARDYSHNGNGANFHGSYYWNGSGGNVGGGAQHATPYICIEEYIVT